MKTINQSINLNEQIKQVSIHIKEGTVTIYETNDTHLEVNGKRGSLFKDIEVSIKEGNLIIQQKVKLFPIQLSQSSFSLGIPKKHIHKLNIKQSTGTLLIKSLSANSINVSSTAARVKLENVQFAELVLKSGTRPCDIKVKGKSGNMSIHSTVGKVNLQLPEVGGNLNLKTGSGGAIISIPKHAPVRIDDTSNKIKINANLACHHDYEFNIIPHVGVVKIVEH